METVKLIVTLIPDLGDPLVDTIVRNLYREKWVKAVSVDRSAPTPAPSTPVDEVIATVRKKAEALQRVVDFAVAELSK